MSARAISLLAFVLFAAACSADYGSGSSTSCTPSSTQVCLRNTAFAPAALTIPVGTTVTFKNADGFTHTTTSSSVPASGPTWNTTLGAGASTMVQFTVAGTYAYYCTIHGTPTTGMHAQIIVQ